MWLPGGSWPICVTLTEPSARAAYTECQSTSAATTRLTVKRRLIGMAFLARAGALVARAGGKCTARREGRGLATLQRRVERARTMLRNQRTELTPWNELFSSVLPTRTSYLLPSSSCRAEGGGLRGAG